MFLIEILLLERSVLILGECSTEICTYCFSLFGLLKPYTWQSAFMPSLHEDMMDFISAPIPQISGMVARDKKHLQEIETDERVLQEIDSGLTVINLSSKKIHWTGEDVVKRKIFSHCKSVRNSWFVQDELNHYQKRLVELEMNKDSSLHSFKKFFQFGLSR